MERDAVVAYLASLTAEERESVIVDAVQRSRQWHRRSYDGRTVCARIVGNFYWLADTDDPTKAEAVHAKSGWHGDPCWVEAATQKID